MPVAGVLHPNVRSHLIFECRARFRAGFLLAISLLGEGARLLTENELGSNPRWPANNALFVQLAGHATDDRGIWVRILDGAPISGPTVVRPTGQFWKLEIAGSNPAAQTNSVGAVSLKGTWRVARRA